MVSSIKGRVAVQGLTADRLRRRFAGTCLRSDPRDVVLPPGAECWPATMRDQLQADLTPAGVLVPLMNRPDGLSVLLTQRSADLKHHGGQISFPGGRVEAHDTDVEAAALRETHEEVGIGSRHIDVIGYLEAMPVITGFAVTPVVAIVSPEARIEVDRTEVDFAFEVPLDFLLDEGNDRAVMRELHGRQFPMTEFHYDNHRIWGATAYMLLSFRKFVLKQ